ncbi:unnamed protein product, partial [Polarella glacialis]
MSTPVRASHGAASSGGASAAEGGCSGAFPSEPISAAASSAWASASRGRSVSPVQTGAGGGGGGAGGSAGKYRSASMRNTAPAGSLSAWPEAAAPSPRTPRQAAGGTEFRLGIVVAELQRQAADERRSVHRQLEHLERKLQDQMAAPSAGRERWADLQGSVSGLLEEMSALARRVESLDEKARLRSSSCEELVRQRTRELEQQLHAQQQKALLAVSTSEEMSKRQTARLRKISQTAEDQTRRIQALEEVVRRPQDSGSAHASTMRLEARLLELEGQQASLQEEFMTVQVGYGTSSASGGALEAAASPRAGGDGSSYDALRALERDLSGLASRTTEQLDEHSVSLANLRVRTDSQEQRLTAAGDRLESVVAPPLEAMRAEIAQFRDHDRQESEARLDHLSRQLQNLSDATEERLSEIQSSELGQGEELPELRRLAEASAAQEQQLRRLRDEVLGSDGATLGSGRRAYDQMREEEICGLLVRVEGLEQRVDCMEETGPGNGDALAQKADRSEMLRLDAAIREFAEPLRRLSARTASSEARSAVLERRVEQIQQDAPWNSTGSGSAAENHGATSPRRSASEPTSSSSLETCAKLEALSREMAEVAARVMDLESVLDTSQSAGDGVAMQDTLQRVAGNEAAVRSLQSELENKLKGLSEELKKASLQVATNESASSELRGELGALRAAGEASSSDAGRVDEALKLAAEAHDASKESQDLAGSLGEKLREEQMARQKLASELQALVGSVQALEDSDRNRAPDDSEVATVRAAFESSLKEVSQQVAAVVSRLGVNEASAKAVREELQELLDSAPTKSSREGEGLEELKGELEKVLVKADEALKLAKASQGDCSDLRARLSDVRTVTEELQIETKKLSEQEGSHFEDLEGRVEQLSKEVKAAVPSVDTADLEAKAEEHGEGLVQLRKLLESEKAARTSLSSIVEDAVQRLEASEEASKAVREELMCSGSRSEAADSQAAAAAKGEAEKALAMAASCSEDLESVRSDLRANQASFKDFTVRLQAMGTQLDAAEKASSGSIASAGGSKLQLEVEVEELKRQVAAELEQLAEHQKSLTRAAAAGLGGSSGSALKSNAEDLEKSVERLAGQVAEELRELREHQGELAK